MSKKVVINACHGGFGVSWAAMQKIAERKGLVASYFPLNPEIHFQYHKTVEPDDHFVHRVIGPRAVDALPDGDDHEAFVGHSNLSRDDADLIATIEEIGEEAASAPMARLRVLEIPDDVEFTIEDYDGSERIAETHRTWY